MTIIFIQLNGGSGFSLCVKTMPYKEELAREWAFEVGDLLYTLLWHSQHWPRRGSWRSTLWFNTTRAIQSEVMKTYLTLKPQNNAIIWILGADTGRLELSRWTVQLTPPPPPNTQHTRHANYPIQAALPPSLPENTLAKCGNPSVYDSEHPPRLPHPYLCMSTLQMNASGVWM